MQHTISGQVLDSIDLKYPRCKIDGATPVTKDTKNIFLELDKLQPEIERGVSTVCTRGYGVLKRGLYHCSLVKE
jgi:tRNA synthetases class I (M)